MTMEKDGLKLFSNMEDHKCFGCGPDNPAGLKMKFYGGEAYVCSWVTVPDHLCGWNNLVHGGVLSTILDEIMSRSILYLVKSLGLTKSMTISFKKPAFVGHELKAEGRILEVIDGHEARAEGLIYNGKREICARAEGIFALLSPAAIRKMGISGEKALEWFDRYIDAGA